MPSSPESRRGVSLLNAWFSLVEQAYGGYLAVELQRLEHAPVGLELDILKGQNKSSGG